MDFNLNNENDQWEFSLDIDDFDLRLTPVIRPSSSTRVETSASTQNPVRIIPGPAGIVQAANLHKENDQWELSLDIDDYDLRLTLVLRPSRSIRVETSQSTQNSVRIIPVLRVSATDYVNANGGTVSGCLGDTKNFLKKKKLDQVVAIVKSCSSNVIGDLKVTIKDLSSTIPETIHHKAIGEGGYEKDITAGAALILANVLLRLPSGSCWNMVVEGTRTEIDQSTTPLLYKSWKSVRIRWGLDRTSFDKDVKKIKHILDGGYDGPLSIGLEGSQAKSSSRRTHAHPSMNGIVLWLVDWFIGEFSTAVVIASTNRGVTEKLSRNNFNDWFRQLKLVLRVEKKMYVIEQPLPVALAANSNAQVLVEWNTLYDAYNEVAYLMLGSMTLELHRQFENNSPYEILQELKSMFEKQVGVKRFHLIQTFHACKQEEGKPVVAYVLQMKGYVDQLERLGYMLPQDIIVGLILNGLTKDFMGFVRNYNMHNIGKTIGDKIQNANKKSLKAKGKGKANGKGKDEQVYIPKPKNPKPAAKEHPAKDDTCHHFKEVGHWKRNCLVYLAELLKKKSKLALTVLQRSKETKTRITLSIHNCHYAPFITRGVVSVYRLVENRFVQCFTDFRISIYKNNVFYFNVIPSNGIYETDMHDLVPNVNSIYNVSTKRAKHNLDSTYLWHCHLAHISKKHIEKLQQERLLKSKDNESFDQCVSCLSGKMTRKSFPHRPERATDLFGIIHTDVCGPLRHVSRQGASYFITFTNDYSRYGYVYLLKHKHELTPPYTSQHNGMFERRNHTLLDMVRSMMNLTTLSLSFWDYALESTICILNMVPTKKVDKTPYELWYGKVPNLSYLKETMGYYFYFPPENKIVVAMYVEFFEKNLITQEVSGRTVDLKEIQDEDKSPSEFTSEIPIEVEGFEPPQEEVISIRRSEKTHRAPNRLCLNVKVEEHSLGDLNEPASYFSAMSKWIFKKKTNMDGIVHTYKARFVAKGYTQLYGVDYKETFSLVADIRAIRILISIVAFYDYEIWQISIYGLKQASRSWNKRFDEEIKKFSFAQNLDELCVYQKASGSNVTFLIFYVDDIIIMENHIPSLQSVKDYLGKCFAMKDLGEAAFIIGIKIYKFMSKRLIGLGQNAYMDKILKRYKMDNSKRGHIPMQERLDLNKKQGASRPKEVKRMQNVPYALDVGSIMYAVRCTRPDVAFVQNITSWFQQNPVDCGSIKSRVKHLFGDVVRAMMSPGRSIVASLENVNGFLAVNTPPDDLIRIDFEQEGVVPKVMLHIFEEFVLLLGQHPFNNEVPHMVVCKVGKPWGGESTGAVSPWNLFSKEIFEGGVIRIHNAFVHD
nr:hypothetical protein [Tanacetum cinerariifolium]